MHLTQSGCSTKNRLLSFFHLALYPRLEAARTSSGCSGLCASQYFCPGGTSALQPGCLQGTYGLYGMRPAPFSILADYNIAHVLYGHLVTFPATFYISREAGFFFAAHLGKGHALFGPPLTWAACTLVGQKFRFDDTSRIRFRKL